MCHMDQGQRFQPQYFEVGQHCRVGARNRLGGDSFRMSEDRKIDPERPREHNKFLKEIGLGVLSPTRPKCTPISAQRTMSAFGHRSQFIQRAMPLFFRRSRVIPYGRIESVSLQIEYWASALDIFRCLRDHGESLFTLKNWVNCKAWANYSSGWRGFGREIVEVARSA